MKWSADKFEPDALDEIRTCFAFGHTHSALRLSPMLTKWMHVYSGSEEKCRNLDWPTDCGPLTVVEIRRVLSDIDRPEAP